MTPEEREGFVWLRQQIQTEKDSNEFDQYVRELNDLLEAKHERIHPEHKTQDKLANATMGRNRFESLEMTVFSEFLHSLVASAEASCRTS